MLRKIEMFKFDRYLFKKLYYYLIKMFNTLYIMQIYLEITLLLLFMDYLMFVINDQF